jgi:ABC-type microcin C transport system permease subunit YejE
LGAKKIISQWDEKKVTWNTQPSTIPSYISNTLIQDASGWYRYSFNITDYVKDWVSNPSNNQGILIYVPWRNENRALNIQSSESSDVSHRPRLVIQYIQ